MIKIKTIREKLGFEKTISETYDIKNNSFDIMRHVFAILVIIYHAYILFFGDTGRIDFVSRILKSISLGKIGVIGFFIISGFLITQSMLNSKSYLNYFYKRILRIYPALIVSIIFCAFIVGPLVTNYNISDYLHSGVKSYVINNLNLFGSTVYRIGDVFSTNPYPNAINGSLWTIKHEVFAYIIIAVLSFFTVLKHKKLTLLFTVFLFICVMLNPIIDISNIGFNIGVLSEYDWFFKLLFYFMSGSLLYLYRDKIIISQKLFILCCLIFILGILIDKTYLAMYLVFPYLVIYLSILKPKIQISKIGDFSYGLYIYAFPVQQLLAYYFRDNLNIYFYIILSIIITLILAIFSWFFVEKPFLSLKNKSLKDKIKKLKNKIKNMEDF